MEILFHINANLKVRAEAGGPKEFFKAMDFLGELPRVCGSCGKPNLRFKVRKSKTAQGAECEYYEVECEECLHRLPFGQNQDNFNLFAKQWEPPYQGGNQQQGQQQAPPQQQAQGGWSQPAPGEGLPPQQQQAPPQQQAQGGW